MHIMISYDIKDNGRRAKVHKALKDYGEWMQYSLFECQVNDKEYQALRRRLEPLIHVEEHDSVRYYAICGECRSKIEYWGGHAAREDGGVVL
jgi:CRISPR-associated protein Cas2